MRYFSNNAPLMQLTAGVNSSVTTLPVGPSVAGLPTSTPYTLVIDEGLLTQELVEVTGISGTNLTVTRGIDGTTAIDHTIGAEVKHDSSARDFAEFQAHQAASSGVHGVVSHLVGVDDTQVLTNKTLSGLENTFTNLPNNAFVADLPKSVLPDDTTFNADTQTLTNKTIDGTNNTLTNLPGAQIVGTASVGKTVLPADTVYTDGTTTFTNKTISGTTNNLSNLPGAAIVGAASVAKSVLPADTVYSAAITGNATTGATAFTAAANWSVQSASVAYGVLGLVCLHLVVQRSGSTLAAGTSGNFANSQMATIAGTASVSNPPSSVAAVAAYGTTSVGDVGAVGRVDSDGKIYLISGTPNNDIGVGDTVTLDVTYSH